MKLSSAGALLGLASSALAYAPTFNAGPLNAGSLAGHWSYADVVSGVQYLAESQPSQCTYESIGKSLNGLPIPALTVTDSKDLTFPVTARPSILFTSLTRGDEPLSLSTLLNVVRHVTNTTGRDPGVTALLSAAKLVFVPIVNPDAWNSVVPEGSSTYWAKNKHLECGPDPAKGGVDLTTNWGFSFDTYLPASSLKENVAKYEDRCSPNYHGSEPFSEPETAALKGLMTTVQPKTVVFFRQTTAPTSAIVVPYSYHPSSTAVQITRQLFRAEDSKVYDTILNIMNPEPATAYRAGTTWNLTASTTSGSDLDWSFDQAGAFSVVLEVANGDIETVAAQHLKPVISLALETPTLPSKSAAPGKSILKKVRKASLVLPLFLGILAGVLLLAGYLVARFLLGYDKVWDRFVVTVDRIKRWRMTRHYRSLGGNKEGDEDDGLDGEDFGWALDEGLGDDEEGTGFQA
ncbi:hypothetical protein HKX48_004656 [Thoreauomyces humboldtii]|nr:hypothetical protein HKX48_004656 [Thoreauomyces humboldtii]